MTCHPTWLVVVSAQSAKPPRILYCALTLCHTAPSWRPPLQATLIPAPGDSVQPYDASTSCEYGPGPWPVGPPQPCNWAAGFAAVRLAPEAVGSSRRLAMCFTASVIPLGARSPDAFLATLVPEQGASGGAMRRRRAAQLPLITQDGVVGTDGGGHAGRRLAWAEYRSPPPPSPPPSPALVEGNAVAARLGAAAGNRRLQVLRRAAEEPSCESECEALGLMLGASSQPGYNLTGASFEAAWGALLQQVGCTAAAGGDCGPPAGAGDGRFECGCTTMDG
jgi:hypothetical protein